MSVTIYIGRIGNGGAGGHLFCPVYSSYIEELNDNYLLIIPNALGKKKTIKK